MRQGFNIRLCGGVGGRSFNPEHYEEDTGLFLGRSNQMWWDQVGGCSSKSGERWRWPRVWMLSVLIGSNGWIPDKKMFARTGYISSGLQVVNKGKEEPGMTLRFVAWASRQGGFTHLGSPSMLCMATLGALALPAGTQESPKPRSQPQRSRARVPMGYTFFLPTTDTSSE